MEYDRQSLMQLVSTLLSDETGRENSEICVLPKNLTGGIALSFFGQIAKLVGRKPFYMGLHVSRTLIDLWCTGEKRDVFTAARQACDIIRQEHREDLVPLVLEYISGGWELVLSTQETEAVRKLAKALGRAQCQSR